MKDYFGSSVSEKYLAKKITDPDFIGEPLGEPIDVPLVIRDQHELRIELETKLAETQVKLDKAISYLKRIERADSVVTALVITKDALVELEDKYG